MIQFNVTALRKRLLPILLGCAACSMLPGCMLLAAGAAGGAAGYVAGHEAGEDEAREEVHDHRHVRVDPD